jgi:hypothetical protein
MNTQGINMDVIDKLNKDMEMFLWFLFARMIENKVVIFVTESAPSWEQIKDMSWIKEVNVVGMYRQN